jgi:hypothetical protein
MKTKLQEIAAGMRQAVGSRGSRVVWLPRGLEIVLMRNEERFVLKVRREGVYPAEREVEIVSQAFGVPVGTEPAQRIAMDWSKGYRRAMYVVEMGWTELPAVDPSTARCGAPLRMTAAG